MYFCDPDQIIGFMLGGEIEIVTDPQLKRRIWQDGWTMYYPNGPEGPEYGRDQARPHHCQRLVQKHHIRIEAGRRFMKPNKPTFKPILILLMLAVNVVASDIETVKPEDVGLSSQRLARLTETFQSHIDKGQIAGAVLLVSRRGKVPYFETLGYMDLEAQKPMPQDGIFRIASMTKAVTAAAVLQLMEQARFQLDDPIEKYLPVFKRACVLDPNQTGTDPDHPRTMPLVRSITIRDLLRHTPGIYGGRRFTEAGLRQWTGSLAGYVETLVSVPLSCQPGHQVPVQLRNRRAGIPRGSGLRTASG